MLGFRRLQFARDQIQQSLVSREPEEVIDAVRLAPPHQFLAGKTTIGPHHDLHLRPTPANPRDEPRHFFLRAGWGVDVGGRNRAASGCPPQNTYSGK